MTLSQLLQRLCRFTTKIGRQEEIIRLAPDARLPTECRKVDIAYSLITVRMTSLLPWVQDQVTESWAITATIKRKDGRQYSAYKMISAELNRAIEVAMLEVTKKAVFDELQQLRAPHAPRPLRMR
jgi:hypothetical protein